MDKAVLLTVASFGVTNLIGLVAFASRLGALELKIETMWTWWLAERRERRVGGRRRTDPPVLDDHDV